MSDGGGIGIGMTTRATNGEAHFGVARSPTEPVAGCVLPGCAH